MNLDFGWESPKLTKENKKDNTSKDSSLKSLDFSTVVSINKTARMIRKDIRSYRLSYLKGMMILIKARNNLQKVVKDESKDRRLKVIKREIQYTKSTLMNTYGNPEVLAQRKAAVTGKYEKVENLYKPIRSIAVSGY